MTRKKKLFILICLSFLGCGVAGYLIKPVEIRETTITINLTETEKNEAIRQARINYITLDSAWALVGEFCKEKYTVKWVDSVNWIDSTRWNYKDSVITKTISVPQYQIVQELKPVEAEKNWLQDRVNLGVSFGYGNYYVRHPDTNEYCWEDGFGFQIGIQVKLITLY